MFNWNSFARIAARKHGQGGLGGFVGTLPDASACDFDQVKMDCCRMRASAMTSVDAVTVGTDGRIYFVEFKDTCRFPLGLLRRKAFDSLVLFWMSLGEAITFDELCQRSVFAYVRPDGNGGSAPDDASVSVVFSDDAALIPPTDDFGAPIENRLNELKQLSLYADVWTISASEFSCRYASLVGAIDQSEFCRRIENYAGTNGRTLVWQTKLQNRQVSIDHVMSAARSASRSDSIQFCRGDRIGDDFRTLTCEINEIRCPLSAGEPVESKRLAACDIYCEQVGQLLFYHDWESRSLKFTRLVNVVFDGFVLWCIIYKSGKRFDQLKGAVSLVCVYEGDEPPLPDEIKIPEWQKPFWSEYRDWCLRGDMDSDGQPVRFGLQWFVNEGCYKTIKTLPITNLVLDTLEKR